MPTERLAPVAVLAQSNLSGTVADIQEPPDSPDAGWLVAVDNAANTDVRVSFPTPSGALSGTQTVRVLVRKSATGGSTPTAAVELWEAGALVATVIPTANVTDAVGVILTGTFTAATVTNPADVEVRVVGVAPGGKPADRRSIGVGAIEWTANVAAAAPSSGSGSGGYALEASATGATTHSGTATGGYAWTGTATGAAPAAPAAPPVISADFETGVDNWAPWYGCTVSQDTTQANTGSGSLAITASDAFLGLQVNNWPGYGGITGDTTYDVAVALNGQAGMTLTFNLEWRQGSTAIRTDTLPATTTGAWAETVGTFTTPAGADTLYVTANTGTASTGQTYRLDSFTVADATGGGGDPVPAGSASGAYGFTGAAAGATSHSGTAAGASSWTGSAAGTSTRQGAGTGTTAWTGSASGTAPAVGQATGTGTGSFTFIGTATGATIHSGTTAGGYVYASTATGTAPAVDAKSGTAAATYGWAATATGSAPTKGTAAGGHQYTGAATGTGAIQPARDIAIAASPIATNWATMPTTANPVTTAPISSKSTLVGKPVECAWVAGPIYLEEL